MLCCSDWCPKYKDCAKAIDNQEYTNRLEQVESLYNYGSCSIQYINGEVVTNEHYDCGLLPTMLCLFLNIIPTMIK